MWTRILVMVSLGAAVPRNKESPILGRNGWQGRLQGVG